MKPRELRAILEMARKYGVAKLDLGPLTVEFHPEGAQGAPKAPIPKTWASSDDGGHLRENALPPEEVEARRQAADKDAAEEALKDLHWSSGAK